MFSLMFLGCSIFGSFSSVLVLIGLRKNQREFLVPWIFVMSLDFIVALVHFFFVVIFGNLKFEPLTGTLFTIDFFIMCLNVRNNIKKFARKLSPTTIVSITIFQLYCLVCIVSQYQEYKIGRGLTTNHYIIVSSCFKARKLLKQSSIKGKWLFLPPFLIRSNRQSNGVSHYNAPEKSCIILHQSKTSPMNNGLTNFTLIQESQRNGSASKCLIIPIDWSFRLSCSSDLFFAVFFERKLPQKWNHFLKSFHLWTFTIYVLCSISPSYR